MADAPLVVVKVGGSLLDWGGLRDGLSRLLASIEAGGEAPLLIVGGGRVVDAVRCLHRTHGLDEETSHRLALRSMDLTALALAALVARSLLIDGVGEIPNAHARGLRPILAPRRFLEEIDERRVDALPLSWATTSDSIAARVAEHLGARLILLKSESTAATSREEAAAGGHVDPLFPTASAGLERVESINPRDARWPVVRLDVRPPLSSGSGAG